MVGGKRPMFVNEEVPVAANGEPGTGRKTLVRINIALAVFDLLLLAALVYLFIYPGEAQELLLPADEPPAERAAEPSAEEPADAEPEETAEPEEPSEPEEPAIDPAAREPVSQYRVKRGDTFYDIAGIYWENEHLWPDLYALNRDDFRDPDFIRPGEQVDIYRSLAADGELSAEDRDVISRAHVEAYRVYRSLGEEDAERGRQRGSRYHVERARNRINKAHWLLYSGHRFNPDLAEEYAEEIDERDLRVVRRYLERFGGPEDP